MSFNSFDFLVFFLIVFGVQLFLRHRERNLFLLAASYVFYGCWSWKFLGLIVLSTVIDFYCSQLIAGSKSPRTRKKVLTLSIVSNLSILGYFKYADFFATSLEQVLGVPLSALTREIILPAGISFYTFQTMSYTIDVYRGDVNRLTNYIDFALYVAFFPQLVAGPIERGTRLAPQINAGPRTTWFGFQSGLWLIAKGLFKKAVIADNLAVVVNEIFGMSEPNAAQVMIGVYAFAFQIYGDFSGYTDIARGVGRMLGYDLMLNFRLPYFATSPSDFWQRWHISLSSWLRDYLYVPLGGNRCGALMTYRNLMLTMVLGGLWHGANWTFVLWGLFHGLILVGYRWLAKSFPLSDITARRTYVLRIVIMFHLTCLGWLLFRAESASQVALMLKALFAFDFSMTFEDSQYAWKLAVFAIPLMVGQCIQEYTKNLSLFSQLSIIPRATLYATVALAIATLGSFGQQQFIYFQF